MSDPARVLIIRPSALGDVCRSVPVLASVRRRWPTAHIDWLVQDSFADAVRHHPMLSGVVEFPRRALGEAMRAMRLGAGAAYLRSLARARYDLVLDMQGLARSGLFAWATRAPRRVGFANAREGGWLGCNERHVVPESMHAVDRMLDLLGRAGIEPVRDMRLYASEPDRAWVRNDFRLTSGRYAVIAPTSRWESKRWPSDRFAHVARSLLERELCVAVVGSRGEREQCAPLIELAKREPRVIDLVGSTSVGQLMALIEGSRLTIANDSAALHMAVGFDRPYVGLYGPTRLDLVGPYAGEREPQARSRGIVLQHGEPSGESDHKRADGEHIGRITTGEVVSAAASLL